MSADQSTFIQLFLQPVKFCLGPFSLQPALLLTALSHELMGRQDAVSTALLLKQTGKQKYCLQNVLCPSACYQCVLIFIFQVIKICPFYCNSMFFVASFSVGGFPDCYRSLILLLTNWTHGCFSFVKQSLLKHQALSGYILFASKKDDPSKSTPTRTTTNI